MTNVDEFKSILKSMADTYEAKNNDYGSAIEVGMNELGLNYINAILLNKTLRLQTLSCPNAERKVKNESLADTLLDIAVYSIEAYRILNKVSEGRELSSRLPFDWSNIVSMSNKGIGGMNDE